MTSREIPEQRRVTQDVVKGETAPEKRRGRVQWKKKNPFLSLPEQGEKKL